MLSTKKNKIELYLDNKQSGDELSAFDFLLCDQLSGRLKRSLKEAGLGAIKVYIDWLPNLRCINIQAKRGGLFVDAQIEPSEFSIACDFVEPDDPVFYPLESPEQFYTTLERAVKRKI